MRVDYYKALEGFLQDKLRSEFHLRGIGSEKVRIPSSSRPSELEKQTRLINMKQTIKITLFTLFIVAGLQPLSAKNRVTELEETIATLKAQYDTLKTKNSNLIKEISDLENDIIVSDSAITQQQELLKSLNDKKASIDAKKSELQNFNVTEADTEKVKNDIDEYKASFVEMATAFLYVPYNEEGIFRIAIPAFELSKGSSYYEDYHIRLKLLHNYKNNTNQLKNYLGKRCLEFDDAHKLIEQNKLTNVQSKLGNIIPEFYKLSCVEEYKSYGEGWEETYLGEIINGIEKLLNSNSTVDKVEKAFRNYLMKLQ